EISENINNDSIQGNLSQLIHEMNIKELEYTVSPSEQIVSKHKPISSEDEFNVIVYEISDIFNNGSEELRGYGILNYLNNRNITSREVYNWLLKSPNDSNYIFLLGVF